MTNEAPRVASPTKVLQAALSFNEALANATGMRTLEMQQLLLLLSLYVRGEVNQQDLTKHAGTSASSISRTIAKLGAGENPSTPGPGWVEANPDPYNRRTNIVRLTPLGKQLLEQIAGEVGYLF
jgi:DNA-binding MarR family transcriptional regulator